MRYAILFFCLCAFLLGYNLWGGSLPNSDDAIYASMARDALARGDLADFQFQGYEVFEKPPLLFWMAAAGFSVFGVGDFAARLPDAVCALLLLATAFLIVRRATWTQAETSQVPEEAAPAAQAGDDTAGWVGGLVACALLLSSALFYFNARRVMTDMPFCLFVFAFFLVLGESGRWRLPAAGLMAGLAVMTKGIAFLPPLLAALGAGLLLRLLSWGRRERRERWGHVAAWACFLCVAGWWHGLQIWQHGGDFLGSYLGYHAAERLSTPLVGPSEPFFYLDLLYLREGFLFTALVLGGLLVLPLAAWRSRRFLDLALALFGLGYAALIHVMQTRLPHYLLPLLVCAGVGVGRGVGMFLSWYRERERGQGRPSSAPRSARLRTRLRRGWPFRPPSLPPSPSGIGVASAWQAIPHSAFSRCVLAVFLLFCAWLFLEHNSYHMLSGDYSPGHKLVAGKIGESAVAAAARLQPASSCGGGANEVSGGGISPPRLVAFDTYDVVTGWYAGRPLEAWVETERLCDVLRSVDMLRRSHYAWCPHTPAELAERLAAERPALVTPEGNGERLSALLAAGGLEPSAYRVYRADGILGLLPEEPGLRSALDL
jgi:hypothetical protein